MKPPEGLTTGARSAWRQAVAVIGEDDVAAFRTAVVAYARAVDLADRARAEWVAADRPIILRQPNGATGVHPLVSAMWSTSRAVMFHAGQLGLTPMSAARLGRLGVRRGPGRPVGAVSAPDRKALPPLELVARPGMRMLPGTLRVTHAANRARGHQMD